MRDTWIDGPSLRSSGQLFDRKTDRNRTDRNAARRIDDSRAHLRLKGLAALVEIDLVDEYGRRPDRKGLLPLRLVALHVIGG